MRLIFSIIYLPFRRHASTTKLFLSSNYNLSIYSTNSGTKKMYHYLIDQKMKLGSHQLEIQNYIKAKQIMNKCLKTFNFYSVYDLLLRPN